MKEIPDQNMAEPCDPPPVLCPICKSEATVIQNTEQCKDYICGVCGWWFYWDNYDEA